MIEDMRQDFINGEIEMSVDFKPKHKLIGRKLALLSAMAIIGGHSSTSQSIPFLDGTYIDADPLPKIHSPKRFATNSGEYKKRKK